MGYKFYLKLELCSKFLQINDLNMKSDKSIVIKNRHKKEHFYLYINFGRTCLFWKINTKNTSFFRVQHWLIFLIFYSIKISFNAKLSSHKVEIRRKDENWFLTWRGQSFMEASVLVPLPQGDSSSEKNLSKRKRTQRRIQLHGSGSSDKYSTISPTK